MIKKLCTLFFAIQIVICAAITIRAETINDDALLSDMMAAETFSFGLEGMIFEAKSEFASRNNVYKFFRQGFGPSLSEKLVANIWNNNQVKLKDGDQIMVPPKEVYFRFINRNSAAISFKTPEHRKNIWGDSKFTKLILRKEDGRWKLFQEE